MIALGKYFLYKIQGPNSKLETHYDLECEMKNKVSKAGKSHKKMKIFNIDMIKDE